MYDSPMITAWSRCPGVSPCQAVAVRSAMFSPTSDSPSRNEPTSAPTAAAVPRPNTGHISQPCRHVPASRRRCSPTEPYPASSAYSPPR